VCVCGGEGWGVDVLSILYTLYIYYTLCAATLIEFTSLKVSKTCTKFNINDTLLIFNLCRDY